jgi:hypothetical protein
MLKVGRHTQALRRHAMSRIRWAMFCAGCVTALPLTVRPAHAADLCGALDVPIVVRGRVVEVGQQQRVQTIPAVVEIVHDYRGPARLVGQRFADFSGGVGTRGTGANPRLQVGEEGLWTLKDYPSGLGPNFAQTGLPFSGRARKDHSPRYEQTIAVAEAVEKLSKTPAARQEALGHEYALSDIPELSAFAIRALVKARTADADAVVDSLLTNGKLMAASQAILDEALALSRDKAWLTSPQRLDLLHRWVGGKPPIAGSGEVITRLDDAVQHRGLDLPTYLGLMKIATDNVALSAERRRWVAGHVIHVILHSPRTDRFTPQEKATALAWLSDQVREQTDEGVRLHAARLLAGTVHVDPRARELIQKLLDTVQDAKVRAALQGG